MEAVDGAGKAWVGQPREVGPGGGGPAQGWTSPPPGPPPAYSEYIQVLGPVSTPLSQPEYPTPAPVPERPPRYPADRGGGRPVHNLLRGGSRADRLPRLQGSGGPQQALAITR